MKKTHEHELHNIYIYIYLYVYIDWITLMDLKLEDLSWFNRKNKTSGKIGNKAK